MPLVRLASLLSYRTRGTHPTNLPRIPMPKVGNVHYPYTAAGKKAAQVAAARKAKRKAKPKSKKK